MEGMREKPIWKRQESIPSGKTICSFKMRDRFGMTEEASLVRASRKQRRKTGSEAYEPLRN